MFVIIGYVVCLGCIFGVYIAHGGNIGVILHALPFEMITIFGGALGAFVVNNQPKVLKATMKALPDALKGSKYTKARYMELLTMLYEILQKARKEGLMAIEKDVESPHDSPIFSKFPVVGHDHHVIEFTTDYLRMMVSGNLNAHEIEALMDSEIDTHHAEAHAPVAALARLAGALPAFGIVAAVLGVVNTMGSVGQPPAVLGGMIARPWLVLFWASYWLMPWSSRWAACLNKKPKTVPKSCSASRPRCWPACKATTPLPPLNLVVKCCFPPNAPPSLSWRAMSVAKNRRSLGCYGH